MSANSRRPQPSQGRRGRIARELHDVIAHSVSVMVIQAGAAEQLCSPQHAAGTGMPLQAVQRLGRSTVDELRRMLGILRDDPEEVSLNPQPGIARLPGLIRQLREAGLPVEMRVEGSTSWTFPGVSLSAFRNVQEALTNTLKHAQPARAQVLVQYAAGGCSILRSSMTALHAPTAATGTVTGWSACGSVPPFMAATSPPSQDPAAGTPCAHGCRLDASVDDPGPHRR